MLLNARNGNLKIDDTDMDYISFGSGSKNLIMIPGVGDGLMTVKGKAFPFAMMYRKFAKDYQVTVFSRKNTLEKNYSTKDMARDCKLAMDRLNIKQADIIGVSQGGMIAQHLAIDYPEAVRKLVLVVTSSRNNKTIQEVLSRWIKYAENHQFKELMLDNIHLMYSKEYLKKNKWMELIAGKFGRPSTFERFIIMAQACIEHDTYEKLHEIKADTLIIGGECDQIVEGKSSKDIAEKIPGCKLVMYPEYGHALYEEAKDFNQLIFDYLNQ